MIRRTVRHGERVSRWYGLGYYDIQRDRAYVYPVGLHLLVQLACRLDRAFAAWRLDGPRYVLADDFGDYVARVKQRAYRAGLDHGLHEGSRRASWLAGYQAAFRYLGRYASDRKATPPEPPPW